MRVKAILALLLLSIFSAQAETPREFYSRVEQHLRSLPSLRVEYLATGLAFGPEGVRGEMLWLRPNRFLHETPEWIHCDTRDEQWRYLKLQSTLIRETPEGRGDWLPESVLLDAGGDLKPVKLEEIESGDVKLTLTSQDQRSPADVVLSFAESKLHPLSIEILIEDGSDTRYEITNWVEDAEIDTNRFVPPEVPAENLIDFRSSQERR